LFDETKIIVAHKKLLILPQQQICYTQIMNTFSILGEIITVEGKRDELTDILQDAEKLLLEKNPDCLLYSVHISADSPHSVFVFETWTDEASHQNCLKDPEVLALIMKGKPLIQDMKRHYTFTTVSKRS